VSKPADSRAFFASFAASAARGVAAFSALLVYSWRQEKNCQAKAQGSVALPGAGRLAMCILSEHGLKYSVMKSKKRTRVFN
jgi:hypothetical protein